MLRPGGSFAANVADGAPLTFARRQAATVAAVFGDVALAASPQVLRGRRFGNLVLLGADRQGTLPVAELTRRLAADPFAARVVAGADVARFAAGGGAGDRRRRRALPAPPPEWLRA